MAPIKLVPTGVIPMKPQPSKNGTASIDILDPGYGPANAGLTPSPASKPLKVGGNGNVQSQGGRPTKNRGTSTGTMITNGKC